MRHNASLLAALGTLLACSAADAQSFSTCGSALQNLSSSASEAGFDAGRAESDCRDAEMNCRASASCRSAQDVYTDPGCQSQRSACDASSQRCDAARNALELSLGTVQSAMSNAQQTCSRARTRPRWP